MSLAEDALKICQLFEGELLLDLMLHHWAHPQAEDSDYKNDLIEKATEIIKASIGGEEFLVNLPPHQMNFVAAVWCAESTGLEASSSEITEEEFKKRQSWLYAVRKSIPSCFCEQDDLAG